MKPSLIRAKNHLIELTVQVYLDRRDEMHTTEYSGHFADMGSVIKSIDNIKSFSELVKKLEDGDFEVLGYFPSDDDMIEDFLNNF